MHTHTHTHTHTRFCPGGKSVGKKGPVLAWNAPKDLREQVETEKKEILRKKELALMAERAAKKSPAAVKMARDAQARKSEAQVMCVCGGG